MNPLEQYPSVRRLLYTLQWITSGATGILGVIFVAEGDVPDWYTTTVAVLAFVWSYTGLTAQSNTPKPPADERGATTGETILIAFGIIAVVVVLIILLGGNVRIG